VTPKVVDASVAIKWILPSPYESHQPQALALLNAWTSSREQILVPDIFWAEVTNVLWKAARTGRATLPGAEAALAQLKGSDLPTVSTYHLVERALQIAASWQRSVYDSLYVALAKEMNAEMITADEKLANALAGRYPVRWLGSL
jgi:predicted nucleic acid-binding protein